MRTTRPGKTIGVLPRDREIRSGEAGEANQKNARGEIETQKGGTIRGVIVLVGVIVRVDPLVRKVVVVTGVIVRVLRGEDRMDGGIGILVDGVERTANPSRIAGGKRRTRVEETKDSGKRVGRIHQDAIETGMENEETIGFQETLTRIVAIQEASHSDRNGIGVPETESVVGKEVETTLRRRRTGED